jgi:hypothetical protein
VEWSRVNADADANGDVDKGMAIGGLALSRLFSRAHESAGGTVFELYQSKPPDVLLCPSCPAFLHNSHETGPEN